MFFRTIKSDVNLLHNKKTVEHLLKLLMIAKELPRNISNKSMQVYAQEKENMLFNHYKTDICIRTV